MIVLAILGILAALIVPMMGTASDTARTEALASNCATVKGMIAQHAAAADVPLSPTGHPLVVSGAWFKGAKLPDHSWTDRELVVETVSLASNVVFPAVKTFNPNVIGTPCAWYNTTNGAFCVRVPVQATNAETLALFNAVNKSSAATLASLN